VHHCFKRIVTSRNSLRWDKDGVVVDDDDEDEDDNDDDDDNECQVK
jgi:hypothetical protein